MFDEGPELSLQILGALFRKEEGRIEWKAGMTFCLFS